MVTFDNNLLVITNFNILKVVISLASAIDSFNNMEANFLLNCLKSKFIGFHKISKFLLS